MAVASVSTLSIEQARHVVTNAIYYGVGFDRNADTGVSVTGKGSVFFNSTMLATSKGYPATTIERLCGGGQTGKPARLVAPVVSVSSGDVTGDITIRVDANDAIPTGSLANMRSLVMGRIGNTTAYKLAYLTGPNYGSYRLGGLSVTLLNDFNTPMTSGTLSAGVNFPAPPAIMYKR
jgi:hypothetical protein